ncbi:hypothetical protein BOTBODRAFT_52477 [Botryobasidium botryosum FD-172 SS1]|uniref:Mitotic checkpoint regulator, MAD2B-interacting-domain-containing protein n=1 Tax=Botryobasidium botryosum (strain FD-172 SS1) TaxID=930990 RepID=A0A067N2V8_BOTB1|nr:hypothetical protein BOTBODRAFT_52477 [Botryobasidium botryosum FD-172 SS1]
MLGIVDYGSDGGSDSESEVASVPKPPPQPLSTAASDAPTKPKSTLGLSLPPPKTTKRRNGPVKIMVELPKPASNEGEDEETEGRQVKKPRVEGSNGAPKKPAGSSSLVAMLPAPTKKVASAPRPPRVLGGGAAGDGSAGVSLERLPISVNYGDSTEEPSAGPQASSTAFLPPSMAKGKGKAVSEEKKPSSTPPVDFFSLGTASTRTSTPTTTGSTTSSIPTLSSAPVVEDYKPPPPTPLDPYPGYYQLPSGQWAAYDPAYYKSHWESWQPKASAESQMGKGWEGADAEGLQSVDAMEELKKGQLAEREARKNITAASTSNHPAAPNMNMKGSKVGNRARSRHQLSTLLNEAYENRAALEEKIAQGKRNKKEGGMKYGF